MSDERNSDVIVVELADAWTHEPPTHPSWIGSLARGARMTGRGARRFVGLFLVATVVTPVVLIVGFVLVGTWHNYPVATGVTLATLFALFWAANARSQQSRAAHAADLVEQSSPVAVADALAALVRSQAVPESSLFESRLVAHSIRSGFTGRTFSIAEKSRTGLPRPLEVPIEPHVLDENDTALETLRINVGEAETSSPRRSVSDKPLAQRRRWRVVSVSLGIGVALFLLARPLLTGAPLASTPNKLPAIIFGVCYLMGLFAPWLARRIRSMLSANLRPQPLFPDRWMIVNSALALALPASRGQTWKLTLVSRAAGVMFILPADHGSIAGRWRVIVGDADHVASRTLTQIESQMLLRAWLSPIPPPTIEQFSDWTGPPARR